MSVFKNYEKKIPAAILEKVKELTKGKSEAGLKKILEKVEQAYLNTKVEPGESVGLVAAESIGEPSTQMTLNTFHFAGVAEMNITVGLPRIIEILDGRKKIKTPMMEIFLKSPYNKGTDIKRLALSIRETRLLGIATEFSIDIGSASVEVKLDKEKMKDISISTTSVINAVKKQIKSLNIKEEDGCLIIGLRSKEKDINKIYKLKEKLKGAFIKGVKGIKQVLPVKREHEFIIITAGTNLKEILKMKEVDGTRTTSNDVFEIAGVLGIEGARQVIINEVFKVIEAQGLNVDIRHIMLIADTMSMAGLIKGITRYGIVSEKASVLARASFETPIKHIIHAALTGEIDYLNSVVENVMLNQPVPVGTGLPGLITKVKK